MTTLTSSSNDTPRVAFFTDSYHEANGVALTSRQFAGHARSHYYPFFSVHAGPKDEHWKRGTFETYEISHSNALLNLEHDLRFDLKFWRHRQGLRRALAAFRPDLVHVTGPGHLGLLGVMVAKDLKVPLVASWHTNVHEFGARRFRKVFGRLPGSNLASRMIERGALDLVLHFYNYARMCFAPNPELVALLKTKTRKPTFLMERGIDADLFSPAHRPDGERPFTIGYIGRLSAEKNVRLFAAIDAELRQAGVSNYRYLIVGEGSERAWLRENLPGAELPGLLRGEDLSRAYASMDAFVFPSETDTFGNVILEAMASGVPVVVSAHGGPKFLVRPGETGYIAQDSAAYGHAIAALIRNPSLLASMRATARASARQRSWNAVFEGIYSRYREALQTGVLPSAIHRKFSVLSPSFEGAGPILRP